MFYDNLEHENTDHWGLPLEFLIQQNWGEAGEFEFVTSSQVILLLLAWGPHLGNHWATASQLGWLISAPCASPLGAILGFFWVVLVSKEQQERANPSAQVLSKPHIIFSILSQAKAGHMAGLCQGGRIFRGMGEKKFEQVGCHYCNELPHSIKLETRKTSLGQNKC